MLDSCEEVFGAGRRGAAGAVRALARGSPAVDAVVVQRLLHQRRAAWATFFGAALPPVGAVAVGVGVGRGRIAASYWRARVVGTTAGPGSILLAGIDPAIEVLVGDEVVGERVGALVEARTRVFGLVGSGCLIHGG